MRTQMHQDAFPGEDISDRPLPEASVPAILALIEGSAAERPLPGIRGRPVITLDHFVLPPELEATEPPEITLGRRDAVRMLVSIGDQPPRPSVARDLARWLDEGDLVVLNTSGTIPAAIDATTADGRAVVVHLSTELPTELHLVEIRRPEADGSTSPDADDHAGETLALAGGGSVRILGRMPRSVRLWVATLDAAGAAARAPPPLRPADPLPLRARLVAAVRLHQRLRRRAGLGGDAVGRARGDRGGGDRPRRPRHRRRPDRAAHRRRLAGGARGAVPRALPGAGGDGPAGQRHPRRRRAGRRRRHDGGAGAGDRRRRGRDRAPRVRVDRAGDLAGAWGARRRRAAHRLARAGGQPPADARGDRRSPRRSSWPTARRSRVATVGTSSATCT